MTHYLPACVADFFAAPKEIRFQASRSRPKKLPKHDPIAPLIPFLPDLPAPIKSKQELLSEERALRDELHAEQIAVLRAEYDRSDLPLEPNAQLTSDPNLTLFIGRLDYQIDEHILKAEFAQFGTIVSCRVVRNPLEDNKPCGYAFVEFQTREECDKAYTLADGQKIGSKHIVVEYEKRRTDELWFPRRLGGGIGFTRANPAELTFQKVELPGRIADALEKQRLQQIAKQEEMQRNKQHRGGFRPDFRTNNNRGDNRDFRDNRGGDRDRDRSFNRDNRGSRHDNRRDQGPVDYLSVSGGDQGGAPYRGRDNRDNRDNRDIRDNRDGYQHRDDRGGRDHHERGDRDRNYHGNRQSQGGTQFGGRNDQHSRSYDNFDYLSTYAPAARNPPTSGDIGFAPRR